MKLQFSIPDTKSPLLSPPFLIRINGRNYKKIRIILVLLVSLWLFYSLFILSIESIFQIVFFISILLAFSVSYDTNIMISGDHGNWITKYYISYSLIFIRIRLVKSSGIGVTFNVISMQPYDPAKLILTLPSDMTLKVRNWQVRDLINDFNAINLPYNIRKRGKMKRSNQIPD